MLMPKPQVVAWKSYVIEANGENLIIRASGPFDAIHRLFSFFNIDPRGVKIILHGDDLFFD